MKRIAIICALILASFPAYAAYIVGPTISTTTGRVTLGYAGTVYVAASSNTSNTPTISLTGQTGRVTAANFTGVGDGITGILPSSISGLQDQLNAIAVSTTVAFSAINSTGSALTLETARATGAESVLSSAINSTGSALTTEILNRQAADSSIRYDVGAATQNVSNSSIARDVLLGGATQSIYVQLQSTGSALTIETNDRASQDSILLGYINSTGSALTSEINRATLAESDLTSAVNSTGSALTTEISDRQAADALKVSKGGDTMTGPLSVLDDITVNNARIRSNGKLFFDGSVRISTSQTTEPVIFVSGSDGSALPDWESVATLPIGAVFGSAATGGGKIFEIGAFEGNVFTQIYDIAGMSWSAGADYPIPLQGASAAYYNGLLYVFGGDGTAAVNAYDQLTNTWTSKAAMPGVKGYSSICTVGSKIYLLGGSPGEGLPDSSVFAYDPLADTWETLTPMSYARSSLVCGVSGTDIYVAGGNNEGVSVLNLEKYNTITDSWETKTSMLTAAMGAAGGYASGHFWVIDGTTQQIQKYDPNTDSWSIDASVSPDKYQFGGQFVLGNAIYMLGGNATPYNVRKFNTDYAVPTSTGGYMGLGTISPTEKLDVNGNVKASIYYGTGQDDEGYSLRLSSSIYTDGCIRFGDGSIQCKSGSGSGTGHTISTTTGGLVTDFPTEPKLAFDAQQFVVTDSPSINSTLIQQYVCAAIAREVPGGDIDGFNDTFTLAHDPKPGTEYVFVNGIQNNSPDDYSIAGGIITFTPGSIPQAGWALNVNYCYPTNEPDINWSPPLKISGSQIQDSSISNLQLDSSLKNPIQSTASGSYKKITAVEYDDTTGLVRITYED